MMHPAHRVRRRWRTLACLSFACLSFVGTLAFVPATTRPRADGFGPGARVLLDAHNAYPERGQWADRIDRALATGLPLAIEQDLYWYQPAGSPGYTSVVAHDDDALAGAPSFEQHFLERIRPLMERALAENQRDSWPLIVLNLDFKDNVPAHLDHVWRVIGRYDAWLTTAPRTNTPDRAEALTVGPLLVLSGSDSAQRRRFHDEIPVGDRLRIFGAVVPSKVDGATKGMRAKRAMRMTAADHLPRPADNFARWANFPWSVVEEGGQNNARAWTASDSTRLESLVQRAHAQRLWIRFYTLDGFGRADNRGFSASYNFGSLTSARTRWQAAIRTGVDFIATDQYADFAAERAGARTGR
ncbi:MAG: hypothetical protein KA154_11975 [Gemmatimonadaceae bacterium]|jgi:hypothetical protein|nr:hypothetical protein [Gemmatimonadaceae bacterium]